VTVPQEVRLERHPQFLDDDGHDILENLATAETDTSLVPHPDGLGGVEWGAESGGGGSTFMGPLLVNNPNVVTTTPDTIYLPLTDADGLPIFTEYDS
jgi:hypothetical protein